MIRPYESPLFTIKSLNRHFPFLKTQHNYEGFSVSKLKICQNKVIFYSPFGKGFR